MIWLRKPQARFDFRGRQAFDAEDFLTRRSADDDLDPILRNIEDFRHQGDQLSIGGRVTGR
jgi:hypothetical protein